MTGPVLVASAVTVCFGATTAVAGVDLEVASGESIAVVGPSGSGKSSLMHCLAGLIAPDSGTVRLAGADLGACSSKERAAVRRTSVGFVFQFADLVPELSLLDNVALACELVGSSRSRALGDARVALDRLGIGQLGPRRPGQVSGGERQRAAVARALVHRPQVVFADEPTGALDTDNGTMVMDQLLDACRGSRVCCGRGDARPSGRPALWTVAHDARRARRRLSRRVCRTVRRAAPTRLALRVVAGTGRAGALRVGVLVFAMAGAVASSLVIAFVPAMATHRDDVAAARTVRQVVPPAEEALRARALDVSVGDRQLRRTYIAADASAPAPPGLDAPPKPGEAHASPELVALMRREPFVASFVPGEVVGTVSPAGLTEPDELFAYIGVADGADLTPASGFGGRGDVEGASSVLVAVQLSLFVLVPACGFLVVSATLSSRARGRRWDAMRSLSVPESVVRHVAAIETGLTSLAGGVLGLALFALVRRSLTGRGVGGLRWFDDDLRLTPSIAVFTLLTVIGTGALLGRRATRITLADSLHELPPRAPSALRALPLVCGTAVLATIGVVHGTGRIIDSAPVFLAGALLAALGLGLVLVPLVHASGALVANRSRRLAWRLGGSRTAYEPRSIARVLAGLVALTVIGHLTFAVLTDLRLVVGDQHKRVVAETSANDLDPTEVDELLRTGPHGVAFIGTIGRGPTGATIAYATCPSINTLIAAGPTCRPGARYRVADQQFPSDLPVGQTYEIATRDATPITVTAPKTEVVDLNGLLGTSTLLIASAAPTDRIAIDRVRYLLERADLLEHQAAVDALDPRLTVESSIEPEQIERYDHHLGIARLGAALGGLLATLTFLVASIDRLLERRSHTATLVAIGVPRRTLRTSQIAQLALPMGVALAAANLVGWLIAQGYLAILGLVPGIPVGLLVQGLALSAAAIAIATATGAVVSVPKDLITHIRAE